MKFFAFDLERDAPLLPSLVECYQEVFATPPWGEWRKCSNPDCDEQWGLEDVARLESIGYEHCGAPVVAYWSTEQVTSDLQNEIGRPGAVCWVVVNEKQKVVGFCLGYPIMVQALNELLSLEGVAEAFASEYDGVDSVVYLDDVGVLISERGKRLGHQLLQKWLGSIMETDATHSVLRTQTEPPTVAYQWYESIGYKVISRYEDRKRRVVMSTPLEVLPLEAAA